MCGIFAYIGGRQAVELMITALKRMEYRGYDSAGIGVHDVPLKSRKKQGKVVNLEAACGNEGKEGGDLDSTIGIAHTRWATHGKPSDANSHPHMSCDCSVAVVHNGVIENFAALRQDLSNKGYEFTSDTDTEVLAHLVYDFRLQMPMASWRQVIAVALQFVKGAYGAVFMFQDEPDLLIAARSGSPLLLGVGKDEYFLASDGCAIVEHTKDVVYLREGDMVELTRQGYKIHTVGTVVQDARKQIGGSIGTFTGGGASLIQGSFGGSGFSNGQGGSEENPVLKLEMSLEQIEKGGCEHFMLKEIRDQPNALKNCMRGRVYREEEGSPIKVRLGGLEIPLNQQVGGETALQRISAARRIIIVACGTSWHSALIGKHALETLAELPCEVEYASEFRYRKPLLAKTDVIFAISQSGETADTLEAIRMAKMNEALTVGIVNGVGSSIARETDAGIYLHAGPEIGVASTKAFTCQTAVLLMVALNVANTRGKISPEEFGRVCEALEAIPAELEAWLPLLDEQTKVISKYFRLATNSLFCGCGVHFPVALEGALKLKEISYIHAEGFPAVEVKHAALTLVRNFIPVFVIAFSSSPAYAQIRQGILELREKNAAIIVLTERGNEDFNGIASFVVHCPGTEPALESLISVIPMQLFSYHIARMRGCEIDQPRNLAKAVTVE